MERRKREKKGLPVEEPVEGGKKKATLMQDDRFKEIFENPDFEVDEESREFALINPATANNNVSQSLQLLLSVLTIRPQGGRPSKMRRTKATDHPGSKRAKMRIWTIKMEQAIVTTVPREVSWAILNTQYSAMLTPDLQQYDPRNVKRNETFSSARAGPSRQPKLVVGGGGRDVKTQTFGQRLNTSSRQSSKSHNEADANVLSTRRSADGGMEMSFIPVSKPRGARDGDEQDEYSGGTTKASRKIEKFGAGMERGQEDDPDAGRGGRTHRRNAGRSASKNAFRKR